MNILNTRIQYLYDNEDEWASVSSAVPLKGELVFYRTKDDQVQVKAGDGNTKLSDLKFVSFEEPIRTTTTPRTTNTELTYNGIYQHPQWIEYHPEDVLITGTISARDRGSYTTTFYPQRGFRWGDTGLNNPISYTWTIN